MANIGETKYEGKAFKLTTSAANAQANQGMSKINTAVFNAGNISIVDMYKKSNETNSEMMGIYAVKNNGVIIGYTTAEELNMSDSGAEVIDVENVTVASATFESEPETIEVQTLTKSEEGSIDANEITPVTETTPEYTTETEVQVDPNNAPLNSNEVAPIPTFKHDDSNLLAQKAIEIGIRPSLLPIVIGISRWETGNYDHLCGGYNYGGVTGEGSAGSYYSERDNLNYAKYSTKEEGMTAYLVNLKTNYFDQGLTTVEEICGKYVGSYSDSWVQGVKGCRS